MLELQGVGKTFGDAGEFAVLRDISLTVKPGELTCVLGPSGCGKTILLHLIAGFLEPTAGTITLNGRPITGPDRHRMMIFQNYVLFPWKNVYENIAIALDDFDLPAAEKEALVMTQLELMGLADFKDWFPYKLSGGMQQRVTLARALVTNPDILLMDEPFSALDSQYRRFLRRKVEEIWSYTHKTILFVTHSISEAITLADTIHLLTVGPATLKKTYHVTADRPRDLRAPALVDLAKEIETEVYEEFEQLIKNPTMEQSAANLLKVSGRRGVL